MVNQRISGVRGTETLGTVCEREEQISQLANRCAASPNIEMSEHLRPGWVFTVPHEESPLCELFTCFSHRNTNVKDICVRYEQCATILLC